MVLIADVRHSARDLKSFHMANGGARPGAGRPAGKPNRQSVVRVAEHTAQGKKLPPEELIRNAENCRNMAARYQPEIEVKVDDETKQRRPNPNHDEERYGYWLAQERDALKAAAPYYAPRLMAMAVSS
jgi:hypothetical protein